MIRLATVNDITQIIELGRRAAAFSFAKAKVDDLTARRHLAQAINDKTQIILVAEHKGKLVGFLVGAVIPYWFSKDKFATDLAFYCHENHGNYAPFMAKKFIRWAKKQPKVIDVSMAVSTGVKHVERIGALYKKIGMTEVGGVFTTLTNPENKGDNHE